MRILPTLVLLGIVLAGCTTGKPPMTSTSTQTAPMPESFTSVISLISDSNGGGEPSLGVTPNGTLFTDLFSNVFRSTDNGTSWKDLGDVNPGIPNNDPDLAVDVDGTVWESRLYGAACSAVSVSRDLGETWKSNQVVCAGPVHDRQYVIPTHGGTAYLYSHQLPTFQQLGMKTTDYGTTWLPTVPPESGQPGVTFVTGGSGWGGGGFWNAQKDSVWFTFNYNSGSILDGKSHAGYAMTSDGGTSWKLGYAADLKGSQLGLGLVTGAADDAGNVYLTWGEADGDKISINIAGSRDEGAHWTQRRFDDGTGSKVFPIIVAGAAGRVAVAFYEGSKDAFPDNMDGTWNVTLASTQDFFGNATITQGQLNDAPVKTTPICISGTTCTGNREFADYFDAVRMPSGQVGVTYNILNGKNLRNGFSLTTADLLGARPAAT